MKLERAIDWESAEVGLLVDRWLVVLRTQGASSTELGRTARLLGVVASHPDYQTPAQRAAMEQFVAWLQGHAS